MAPRSRPVSLRFGGESGRHGLLLGASGSGKSNALTWCLARHIEAGFGAVVIEMKGDQLLAKRLKREADSSRIDFYKWTLDGGERWNPLARGNRSELKDKLIEGGHGELLMPGEGSPEIDLLSVLDREAVALFSLNSSRYGATAKLVGSAFLWGSEKRGRPGELGRPPFGPSQ